MAKTTFLEKCVKTCLECDLSGNGPTAVTGQVREYQRVISFVADADREVQGVWFDWDFLYYSGWSSSTVIGTATVSAPSDIGMWDEDSFYLNYTAATYRKLSVIDFKEWRASLRQGVQTNQQPTNIVILPDQSLRLYPPPDAVYTLTADYWKRPAVMVNASDTSPVPEEYERIIIARAKMAYGELYSAPEIYQAGQVEYAALLGKMESKYLSAQKGRRFSDPGALTVRPE